MSVAWNPSAEDVHVLKKDLISRQLRKEISLLLVSPNSVAALLPTSNSSPSSQFPILSPLFTRILLPFPPLKDADNGPEAAWRIFGTFLGLFQRVDSGGTSLHLAKRDLLANKLLDVLAAMLGKAVRTTNESNKTSAGAQNGGGSVSLGASEAPMFKLRDIVIVDAKVVKTKGFFKSTESVQYVITSSLNGRVRTAERDYAAFKSLHKELIRRKNLSVPALPLVIDSTSFTVTSSARISLATYLQNLSYTPSATLRDFLNQSEPLDHVSMSESDDGSEKRAREINAAMDTFRDELLAPGGMGQILRVFGEAEEVAELPIHYQKAIDWWKICMAATLYRTFITDDRAAEHQRRLKHFHSRAPYRSWAALLKGTNAIMVVKAIAGLLLAKPFGSKCLLQSILASTIDDEIRATTKEIDYVHHLLGNDMEKLDRANAIVHNPSGGYTPEGARNPATEVLGADLPTDHPDRLAADKLLELLWQHRRMHQLKQLAAEDVVVDLARTILSATDPGSFIRDAAKFISDLIKVVDVEQSKINDKTGQDTSSKTAPLQPFLVLLARHEQRIFKHVHTTISTNPARVEALADIANWVDDVAQFFHGVGPEIDLVSLVNRESADIDIGGLESDIEKLKSRKRQRELKRWERILDRVRGFARKSPLEDELDDPAQLHTLRMQDVWESKQDLSTEDGGNSLKVPKSMHRTTGSIASFESIGLQDTTSGGNDVNDSLDVNADDGFGESLAGPEDMEAQIRALFLNEDDDEIVPDPYIPTWTVGQDQLQDQPQNDSQNQPPLPDRPPAPTSENLGGVPDALPRETMWKDPVACDVTPRLLDKWIDAMKPWLNAITPPN
ncbi:hypothetical protein PhCBS80983_g05775 [Powellomyces hirtus]|uniref:PX domain-containing protein n=1 Tax=Powellomyces hirtus TaxID=109895 RepID=A0A507DSQ8_9FUNG|nr:hypothetical protein PhCBS80983_g05775 [Powellomyces hirtus]